MSGRFLNGVHAYRLKNSGSFCEEISRDRRKVFRWESKICVQQTKTTYPDFRSVEWI